MIEQADRYEALVEFLYLTPVGIMKFSPDGQIELANPVAAQLLMPLAADFDLSNMYALFAQAVPDLRQRVEGFEAVAGQVLETKQLCIPGMRTVLTLTVDKVNHGTLMAVIQDITRAIEQETRIRGDQQRFHAIFENIRDCAICTVAPDGRIEDWNRSLNRIGGWEAADVTDTPVDVFFSAGKDGTRCGVALLERAVERGTAEIETWGSRRNGSTFWSNTVATALPDREGHAGGFVLVIRDLTDRKQIEDRLVALATTDPLTKAFNRRAGDDRLSEAFGRWRRYGRAFVVLMIDCDHFKAVNDHWGHDGGDAVLVALVALCRKCVRETDVVIRWGGEEFLLLLPETSRDIAMMVAERLRQSIEAVTIRKGDGLITFTVSIGVAEATDADFSADDAVRRADRALYIAKSAGRNRVVAE